MTAVILALLAGITLAVLLFWHTAGPAARTRDRTRALKWRIKLRLRPTAGTASAAELAWHWSRLAACWHGRRIRPSTTWWGRAFRLPATDYAIYLGRAIGFRRVWSRAINHTLLIAPPQSGKTAWLAHRIERHPGPVMAASSLPNLWSYTVAARSRGPVWVFNPLNIGGLPSTIRFPLLDGCEDPATALQTAEDLIIWVQPGDDLYPWQMLAKNTLGALLHFAALQRDDRYRTLLTVHGWLARNEEDLIIRTLESQMKTVADPASIRIFAAAYAQIAKPSRSGDSVRTVAMDALAWISDTAAREAVTADPHAAPFSVARWSAEGGTLYLVAPGDTQATIAPLVKALACRVHRDVTALGARSVYGRCEPPALYALDEVTQVAPVPLPLWTADSTNKGIQIAAVVHSYSQLADRYGEYGAQRIWDTMPTKILWGGLHDAGKTLKMLSELCGDIRVGRGEDREQVPVLPVSLLAELPDWWALCLQKNRPPVIVKMARVWQRNLWRALTGTSWRPVQTTGDPAEVTAPQPVIPVLYPDRVLADGPEEDLR